MCSAGYKSSRNDTHAKENTRQSHSLKFPPTGKSEKLRGSKGPDAEYYSIDSQSTSRVINLLYRYLYRVPVLPGSPLKIEKQKIIFNYRYTVSDLFEISNISQYLVYGLRAYI
jgi:hypothetical protein